jgi:hypothetical protein
MNLLSKTKEAFLSISNACANWVCSYSLFSLTLTLTFS